MAESAERRHLVSIFRVVDDTLGELGLPGPFDILPNISELIHTLGLPTPDDLGESLKAKIGGEVQGKAGGRLPKLF